MSSSLLQKYNVAGPRYTSYPTVPYWDNATFSNKKWKASVKHSFEESNAKEGISIYIHLPFCESMCTFCGCNKRITKLHTVELPYINAILKEWRLYLKLFKERPIIKELHLGGGTPTFFSSDNLSYLITELLKYSDLAEDHKFSFEGHPNNTTQEHLQALYDVGFRRVCFGVQDYNATVQSAINRIQPFENVKRVTDLARAIGYTSVGHDIIFGLPFQNILHIEETILKTKKIAPDRIAFYSYAHVPWIKGNGQRGFTDSDLPNPNLKRAQYELGKKLLNEVGYEEIGMDHFALKTDELYKSMNNGNLNRNFMGYSASKTQMVVGLGVSSISDSWYGFSQNVKDVSTYYKLLKENKIPVFKGHILTEEDIIVRSHILNLMCKFQTKWDGQLFFNQIPDVIIQLKEMENDGLVEIFSNGLKVTEEGKPFIRNICMAFDLLLQGKKPNAQLFSKTI